MRRIELKVGPVTLRPLWWWNADSRIIEAFSGMLAWYWGILLLLPFDTFGAGRSYIVMQQIATEEAWGVFYCIIGLIQSIAMCGNVYYLRFPASLLAVIGWSAASMMVGLANPVGHGLAIYGLLALANGWVIIRGPTRDGN